MYVARYVGTQVEHFMTWHVCLEWETNNKYDIIMVETVKLVKVLGDLIGGIPGHPHLLR